MQITPTAVTDGLALQLLFHRVFHFHLSGAIPSVASVMQPFLCGCDRTQCHTQLMASRSPRTRRVHRQETHPFLCRRVMSICLPTCSLHGASSFAGWSLTILPPWQTLHLPGLLLLPPPRSPGLLWTFKRNRKIEFRRGDLGQSEGR